MGEKKDKTKLAMSTILGILSEGDGNRFNFESFKEKLDNNMNVVDSVIKTSTKVVDSYGNTITSIGTDDKIKQFTKYGFSNDTLNFRLWTTLYNDSWVFRRAIDKPAQDIVKLGIELNTEASADVQKNVMTNVRKLKTELINIFKWGALYGGSIGFMMFDNMTDEEYAKPFNKDKYTSWKSIRIYVTDRWYGCSCDMTDVVGDMSSVDYGKPEQYRITFPDGKELTVHHDFILRYEHRNAPRLIKSGYLMGWGYAEGAHIFNELSRDDDLKSAITSLINKSLIEVIKMDGMRGVFMGSDEESELQLRKRLEMVNWARSYNSLTLLDTTDEYQQNTYGGLGGLSDLLEKNMWLISAALEMQGVLYGDLTQGFSHDTEALERYDDTIQGRADEFARPVYEKLLITLYKRYGINEKVDFEFGSLLVDKKEAQRVKAIDDYINVLSKLLGDGVIDVGQYLESLHAYVSKSTIDLKITPESIEKAKQREKEESEDFNV